MSVKTLTKGQKEELVRMFKDKTLNQKELGKVFHVSPRTVGRVLQEAGLLTAVPRLQVEANTIMKMMKKHGIDLPTLAGLMVHHKTGQAPLDFNPQQTAYKAMQTDSVFDVVSAPASVFQPEPDDEWLVGEFKTRHEGKTRLEICEGADHIAYMGSHPTFIRWVGGPGRTSESPKQPISHQDVFDWLVKQSNDELSKLMYEVGLVKISEIHNQSVMSATLKMQQKAEANAKQS